MAGWVALLRGVNVGGHNKVPMGDLRDLCAALGFHDVRTYIQTGNIVFDFEEAEPDLVSKLERGLKRRYGFEVPVIVRTQRRFAAIAKSHPLANPRSDPKLLMVAFLDREPTVAIGDVIEAAEHLPNRFLLDGREVYLDYPGGSAGSKLNYSLLEDRLEVSATVRNWRTVQKVAELARR